MEGIGERREERGERERRRREEAGEAYNVPHSGLAGSKVGVQSSGGVDKVVIVHELDEVGVLGTSRGGKELVDYSKEYKKE